MYLPEIDVCLAVVATAIKYLSATALRRDALAVASAYRIREIIMRAFISFDKRLCRSAIPRSACKRRVSGNGKNRRGYSGKSGSLRRCLRRMNRSAGLYLCIGFPLTESRGELVPTRRNTG